MASRKPKTADQPDGTEPSFEQALEQLEALVEAMENEQLPLEQLVASYEQGSKLLGHCQRVLGSARERIELITLENQRDSALENAASLNDGGAGSSPSRGSGQPSSQGSSSPDEGDTDDDDIRLF